MDPDTQDLGELMQNTRETRIDLEVERRDREERNAINSGLGWDKTCNRKHFQIEIPPRLRIKFTP